MFAPALLSTLIAVCETGSFELAAARLGVTPPAVSQRMRALAEAAGGAIFSRLSPARPTTLGLRLLRHARDVAALQADLAADLGQSAGPRPVSIALNADSLEAWAVPALAEAPGFRLDVQIRDQDHSAAALRRGEVSAALTSEASALPGCDVHRLGALRYIACCTPEFYDRHFRDGVTAAALDRAPMIQFSEQDGLQARWARTVVGAFPNGPINRIPAPGPFLEATRLGLGWGTNPERLVRGDLDRGALVPLMADRPLDTLLYWQVSRIMADVLLPLTTALRRHARAALRQTH